MAIVDRALVRAEISALFDDIEALEANLAYPPLELSGRSPVVSLHGDGTIPQFLSADYNQFDHFFVATIYVNRRAHGGEMAEALLDAIYTAILQAARDAVTGVHYMEMVAAPGARSRPSFPVIDGIPYRVEEIYLMARSYPSG